MSDLTNYTEGVIRDWMSQGTDAPTAPGNLYVGLHTSDPGESPDGSTEVGAGDYARVSTTAGGDWNTPNENDFENASEVTFGETTNNWGDISHVSLWDGSSTSDNCLASYPLNSTKTVSSGDEPKFDAGDLSFSLD